MIKRVVLAFPGPWGFGRRPDLSDQHRDQRESNECSGERSRHHRGLQPLITEILRWKKRPTVLKFDLILTVFQTLNTAATTQILDCDTFQPFWVSWFNSVIKVGTGTVLEQGTFLSFNETSPVSIAGITFATGDPFGIYWYLTHFTGACPHYPVRNLVSIETLPNTISPSHFAQAIKIPLQKISTC